MQRWGPLGGFERTAKNLEFRNSVAKWVWYEPLGICEWWRPVNATTRRIRMSPSCAHVLTSAKPRPPSSRKRNVIDVDEERHANFNLDQRQQKLRKEQGKRIKKIISRQGNKWLRLFLSLF